MEPLNAKRHSAIYDPAQYENKRVTVIGVGTIGSWLVQILARMQVNMNIFDHDTIEEHNLTTQVYGVADIGKTKVAAVLEQLAVIQPENRHAGFEIEYDGSDIETIGSNLIISCVDSLDARRSIAQMLIEKGIGIPIVDGRVGREQGEVYAFENATAWLAQLPEKGDTDPCGARFSAYTAVITAGFMANTVKRIFMVQMVKGRIIYDAASYTYITE